MLYTEMYGLEIFGCLNLDLQDPFLHFNLES